MTCEKEAQVDEILLNTARKPNKFTARAQSTFNPDFSPGGVSFEILPEDQSILYLQVNVLDHQPVGLAARKAPYFLSSPTM